MDLYYEIARHPIGTDVERITVQKVPVLIDLLRTTVETDKHLKNELVIIARNELKMWDMSFKFERRGNVLCVIWDFGPEDPRVLGQLSFTIRVHPDDYAKMDFPDGQVMVFGTR